MPSLARVTRGGLGLPRFAVVMALLCAATTPGVHAGDSGQTPSPSPSPTSGPAGGAQTPDERREVLDRELDASLSAFDAMLLKEQQAAAAKRAEEASSGGGTGTGEGGEGDGSGTGGGASGGGKGSGKGGEKGDGKGGSRPTSARDGSRAGGSGDATNDGEDRSTGSARGGSRPGGGRTTASAPEGQPPTSDASIPPPPDVGDGRDDDVVARQIREAAMKEEDPAIREKLWDEYRRYKGIRSGGN